MKIVLQSQTNLYFVLIWIVCDVVYNPEETKLLREAKEAGCAKTIGGKGMLLWQGVAAYKLYTGLDMPVEEYKKYQAENQK